MRSVTTARRQLARLRCLGSCIARSVLLDGHEAEDVVQETYILAFTRLVARFFDERNAPNRKISVPSLPLRLRSA